VPARPAPIRFPWLTSTSKCDGRHYDRVTNVTDGLVIRGTPDASAAADDSAIGYAFDDLFGEVNGVADKKVTPKAATKTASKKSTGAATRVTKVAQKKMKKKIK
jgi:hypothetical protein